MMLKNFVVGAAIAALTATGASASMIKTIDYTDGVIDMAAFGSSITYASTGGDITDAQRFDGTPGETDGLAEVQDGLGIGFPDDEISFPGAESITVTFGGRGVRVVGLHFLDLFLSDVGQELEDALVSFNGGAPVEFNALVTPGGGNGGYAHYTFAPIEVGSITFTAGPTNDNRGVPDYALAGIDVAPIPLPAAGWMFISALAGMGFLARRRKA